MSQQNAQQITLPRLMEIAKAPKLDQNIYLENIQIHLMNRKTFKQLKINVDLLDSNDENQNNLKRIISGTYQTQNERLQLEQKKQKDKEQENKKDKSDYVAKVLALFVIFIGAFCVIAYTFFKNQYTSSGGKITISMSDLLVGIGCQIIIATISLAIYCCVITKIRYEW